MKNPRLIVSVFVMLAFFVVSVSAQQHQSFRTSDRQVKVILQRLERSTGKFRNSLNAALALSNFDQTIPENDINAFEPRFENATRQLQSQFDRHVATVTDVESVLQQALFINRFMARNRLNRQVQNDWAAVRTDLGGLSSAYSVNWQWTEQPFTVNSNGSLELSNDKVNQLIQRIETAGDTFRTNLTEAFSENKFDQTNGERNMNDAVRGLKNETNQLRNQFDNRQSIAGCVERLLARAMPIDTYMHTNLLTSQVQNDWSALREDINKLAGAFNLAAVGRN
jgi:hypothetical protein